MAKHDNHNAHTSQWGMSPNGTPDVPSTTTLPNTGIADQLMMNPGAAGFTRVAQSFVDKLAAMPPRMKEILQEMHAALAKVDLNGNLSAAGKRDLETQLRRDALASIDELQQQSQLIVRELEDLVDAAVEGPKLDPQSLLVQELQVGRAWQRIVRRLEAANGDPAALVRIVERFASEAAQSGDRTVLIALRAELESFLTAIRQEPLYSESIEQRLDELELPFLSPRQRAARQLEQQARIGWNRLVTCFAMAKSNASGGNSQGANLVLPGWDVRESLNLGSYKAVY